MAAKVPALTLSLVRDELFKRGWQALGQQDDDMLRYQRGGQKLSVPHSVLRSSKFNMRSFMRDLDAYDIQGR